MASGCLLTQFQTQRTLDVCLQGPSLTNKASTPPRAGNRRTQTRGTGAQWGLLYSRQLASSVRSSQSKSPSQRHNLRAQCPFPQGNSLGSQGGGGPVWTSQGVMAVLGGPESSPHAPALHGPHHSPVHHCHPCSLPDHHKGNLWGYSARCGMWPPGVHRLRAQPRWETETEAYASLAVEVLRLPLVKVTPLQQQVARS